MTVAKFTTEWAESGDTGTAPDTEKKETGYVRSDKPWWQRFNFLQNRVEAKINEIIDDYSLADTNITTAFELADANIITAYGVADDAVRKNIAKNLKLMTSTAGTSTDGGIVFMAGLEILYQKKGTTMYSQNTDGSWTSRGTTTPKTGADYYAIKNHSHVMFNGANGNLECYANSSPSTKVTETVTGLGEIRGKCSKYETGGSDDHLIMGDVAGITRFSTTGIGGTWVTPTTDIAESVAVKDIAWLGGDVFLAACNNKVYVTTNNGIDWSVRFTDTSTTIPSRLKINEDGFLMGIFQDTGGDEYVKTSDDDGVSWDTLAYPSVANAYSDLLSMGGESWMVSGLINDGTSQRVAYAMLTTDNGATWSKCNDIDGGFFNNDLINMATDGERVYLQHDGDNTVQSLSY
ncbi:hypothetical protein KAR91_53440 [Candidatus Pacearchaeota archaeon]|nr:hypothetical protein [Candidatus Pacearchaeota archaeon]